ncbi:MAG: GNAT family N-acetyltransferase [Methylotenera sp.]|nr:GNAT family N-acetyltransferase [Methylotenera sp.]
MVKAKSINIQTVSWQDYALSLREIRTQVFIVEQHVTEEFEWDALDENAIHLLAMVGNQPIACARIIGNKIGRMAVIKTSRGKGFGMALIQKALEIIKNNGQKGNGKSSAHLSAQTHAIGFYQRAGFVVTSEEYCDVDIPHVDMEYNFESSEPLR